uniref:MFS transporter n=1 Tax=Candidatus Fimivicinus sp. TaxID=3056640 RepID=UPI003FEE4C90
MSVEIKEATKVAEPTVCKTSEKIGHAIGVLGHDSAYNLWSTWMMPFLTDILMLPAAFIGVLTTFSRIFDAFTDISMGVIADRTRSKFGRFRPWVLRAGPIFCLCMALSFLKLPIGVVGLCVFAGIMYLVTGSLAFTAVDIPFWSLPAAMTSNTKERSSIIGTTTTVSNAVAGAIGIILPLALAAFGEFEWTSYFYIAVIVAIFASVMYLISFKMVKEHVVPDDREKFSLRLAMKNIFTNQPLLCVQLSNVACLLAIALRGYLNYYYCMYNLGDIKLASLMSMITLIGMVVGSILFIFGSKLIGKRNCMFAIAIIYTAANLALYAAGWSNLTTIFVCAAVSNITMGAAIVCVNAMLADTIEYGEWKTGQRNEAMITSTRCFVTKCVSAVAGLVVALVIGLTGMVPQAAEQAPTVLNSFHFVYTLGSAGVMILAIVPMFFYKLTEKRHAEIMEELAARKADKGNK